MTTATTARLSRQRRRESINVASDAVTTDKSIRSFSSRKFAGRATMFSQIPLLALALTIVLHNYHVQARTTLPFAATIKRPTKSSLVLRSIARGGASVMDGEDEEKGNEEEGDNNDVRNHPDFAKLKAYRMRQQALLQLRATALSEALAARGLPIPSIESASTPVGATPPQKVDWDCALSTKEKKLTCMYTFDDEVGTKFIAPIDPKRGQPLDDEWITVAALNQLRRNDRSKVLKMWHDKYAILDSWFTTDSEYSVLQHVGPRGILLNFLLDDVVLTMVVALSVAFLTIMFMPLLEMIAIRFLVSGTLWMRWISWGRFVHVGLPFKLMVGSWLLKAMLAGFGSIKGKVKKSLVEIESDIMAASLPLTLGVPTPAHVEEGDAEILNEEEEIMEHLVEEDSGSNDEEDSEDESDSD